MLPGPRLDRAGHTRGLDGRGNAAAGHGRRRLRSLRRGLGSLGRGLGGLRRRLRGGRAGSTGLGNTDGNPGSGADAGENGDDLLLVGRARACLLHTGSDLMYC